MKSIFIVSADQKRLRILFLTLIFEYKLVVVRSVSAGVLASKAARAGSMANTIAGEAHWLKLAVSFLRLIIEDHMVV